MEKLNVGIIGYSWVATAHIKAINDGDFAQVNAIYSSRNLDGAALSREHGSDIKTYTDLNEMLKNGGVDVVVIGSYNYQHKDQAVAAANAGKHIYLEKPIALTWDDCLAIEEAVKKNNVKFCVGFECRYSNQFLVTKSVVDFLSSFLSGMFNEKL